MMRVGLIINPIAGMGGSVGLKGTDGSRILRRSRALGATPVAPGRALRAARITAQTRAAVRFVVPNGSLGADVLSQASLEHEVIDIGSPRGATATRLAALRLLAANIQLLVFAGGDGTARNILEAVGEEIPVLGIPAGVKMHSAAFAVTPEAAGRLIADWAAEPADRRQTTRAEIVDIDEDLLRQGRLNSRLYGHMAVPRLGRLVQTAKSSRLPSDEQLLAALGHEIAGEMQPGTTYFFGTGSTAKRPLEALGLTGTLLGLDAVRDGQLIGRDLTGRQAGELASAGPYAIISGVTGGQGFVCGRGNQQITPGMIAGAWPANFTIIASRDKLARLKPSRLLIDTGDAALDARMRGHVRVRTGPRQSMVMQLV